MCVDLSRGFLFCPIDLYFCLCASTILSWWLWLCSRAWILIESIVPAKSGVEKNLTLPIRKFLMESSQLLCIFDPWTPWPSYVVSTKFKQRNELIIKLKVELELSEPLFTCVWNMWRTALENTLQLLLSHLSSEVWKLISDIRIG